MMIPQCDLVCPECEGRLEISDASETTLDVICCECDSEFSLEHSEVYRGRELARDFMTTIMDEILADC